MPKDLTFVTHISGLTSKGLILRKEKLSDLIEEADFVSSFFLSLTGRKPQKKEKRILNAILVSSLDQGISSASGFVPRVAASSGGDVLSCMATAILALGPLHGAAVTAAMELFVEVAQAGENIESQCDATVMSYRRDKKRLSGFGSPTHADVDERARQLFSVARKENFDLTYLNIAKQLEHSLEQKMNRKLPLNIDGAIAALLLTIGISPLAGNAIFAVGKVAGSIAHILEEKTIDPKVRRIQPEDIEYAA